MVTSIPRRIALPRASFLSVGWRLLRRHHQSATGALIVLVVLNFVVQQSWNWAPGFLGFEIIFALLTISLPAVTVTILTWVQSLSAPIGKMAELSSESASTWLDDQLSGLLVRWAPLVCGSALVLMGVVSTVIFWIPWRGWVGALFFIWAGVFFFGYGTLAWVFGSFLVLVWRISNLAIKCSPFRWPLNEIQEIYAVYFRVLIVGALLYGLVFLSIWVSPNGDQIALETPLGLVWTFLPAACVIGFFVIFHIRIHILLLRYKRASEQELTTLLDNEYQEWLRNPGAEREDRIAKLIEWREHIRKADEWPLGFRSVLLTVTTLLLPPIKEIVEWVVKQ